MYIPVMAFVTYILLSTLLAGLRGAFHPEVMGLTATTAFAVVALEILGLKFGTYVLSISNDSQLLDLVAYSGYKFVGVIVTLVVAEILNRGAGTGGWAGWTVFTYTWAANAFFLVSSLDLSIRHSFCCIYAHLVDHQRPSCLQRSPYPSQHHHSVFQFIITIHYVSFNNYIAPLSEIRSPPRLLLHTRRQRDANRRPLSEEPTDAISLPLLLSGAVDVYVDFESAG